MISLFFNTAVVSEQNSTVESFANVCFSPVRYLFEGRTIAVFDGIHGKKTEEEVSYPEQDWKRTAIAVIALVPATFIGVVAKLISYCFASARENYQIAKNQDLFNFDLIYSQEPRGFVYSLPRENLEGLLSGKAFDNREGYTAEQQRLLKEDIRDIYQSILSGRPEKTRLAIITAGSPGAGKTTLLNRHRNSRPGKIAYTCFDDVFLRGMVRTYQADIQKVTHLPPEEQAQQRLAIYNKWRPATHVGNELTLAHLIRQKYSFYFGSALSSSKSGSLLEFLKRNGYTIKLLHVTANDDVRVESIKERDKTFIQTTEKDIREKDNLVPQRIMDTYLRFADEIEFFYRGDVEDEAHLAAIWKRNDERSERKASGGEPSKIGSLIIKDRSHYNQIRNIHNAVCDDLDDGQDLRWEATVEQYSDILVDDPART